MFWLNHQYSNFDDQINNFTYLNSNFSSSFEAQLQISFKMYPILISIYWDLNKKKGVSTKQTT